MYNLFSKKFARLQTRLKIISLNPKKLIMKSTAIGLLGALGYIWIRGDEHLNQTLTFNTRVLSEITIPKMLRYSLFSWYCKKYNVNTE